MTLPSAFQFATISALAALAAWSGVQAAEPASLSLDAETVVDGVSVGCTGIGQARLDPKWDAYSVRIEFANPKGELLSDEAVTVSTKKGAPVVAVSCAGPWILMKLTPGTYTVEGRLLHSSAAPRTAPVKVPKQGQAKVGFQFPDV